MLIQHKANTDIRTYTSLTPYELANSSQLKKLLSNSKSNNDAEEGSAAPSSSSGRRNMTEEDLKSRKESNLINKLNLIKEESDADKSRHHPYGKMKIDPKKIKPRNSNSQFYSNLSSVIGNRNKENPHGQSQLSQTVVYENIEEKKYKTKRSLSRISESINNSTSKRSQAEMYNRAGSLGRKNTPSVKRPAKSRLENKDDHKPFYLPDIKANYSEYSKYDGATMIPKSLKEYRKLTSKKDVDKSRFFTPSRKVKIL